MLKKFGRVVATGLFPFCLIGFAFGMATNSTLGQPEPLKESLADSGLYDQLIPSLLESVNQDKPEGEGENSEIPLDNPEIQAVINKAVSPEVLENSANSFLDGIYGWLNGETAEPEFKVDLTKAKADLIQGIADYAEKRLLSLKPCSQAQLRQLAGEEINPFTVPCRPPIVVSQEKKKLIKELNSAEAEFLKDPVLSAEDLKEDNPDKFNQELKDVPNGYQMAKNLPIVSAVLGLLAAAGIIFLNEDRRKGLKIVFIITLATGLFMLASSLLLQGIYDRNIAAVDLGSNSQSLKDTLLNALGRLYSKFNRIVIVISAAYSAIGGAGLGALWFTGRGKNPAEQKEEPKTSAQSDKIS